MKNKAQFSGFRRKFRWYILGALITPIILYIPGILGETPYPSESAEYTDLLITHYPYAVVLKRALFEHHILPLWSSLIYSGMPFASNPLSGLFYLPGWIAILFPLPAGISVVIALHMIFGTFGFYLFLKDEGLSDAASLAGALAFGFLPKIASHYGAGHVTLIYAISWTPWLFIAKKRDSSGWMSGAVAGMLFLADPRWAVYAGIFWISHSIAHSQPKIIWDTVLFFLRASITASMVAAPLMLPLIEFSSLATRSVLSLNEMLVNSLPTEMLAGLVIPGNGGNPEWAIYTGGVAISLFVLQLTSRNLRKTNLFWMVWLFLSILLSLGGLYSSAVWIAKIPLISMLRVPARAIMLGCISITVIAAKTIHVFSKGINANKAIKPTTIFLLLFSASMIAGLSLINNKVELFLIWGFIFVFLSALVVLISIQKEENRKYIWVVAVLLIVDLAVISFNFFTVNGNIISFQDDVLAKSLIPKQNEYHRIYSPSYSIPQDQAATYELELADGVDPMQLTSYRKFMDQVTGIETSGYSVSIPRFETGNPGTDNLGAIPDLGLLSLLNVKYLVSKFEIPVAGLELIFQEGDQYVYRNNASMPRVWIEEDGSFDTHSLPGPNDIKKAAIIFKNQNSIAIQGSGPGRLILSELVYPGWSVTIDEEPAQLEPAYDILRSVYLDEGNHNVIFSYHPATVYLGILMAAVFWVCALLLWIQKLV